MTNVVNDQCGSQDKDQPTNLSINNPSFNEISTNENRSLFNSTQVPVSHDNQRVTIDLTTKPKEGVNIIYNPQPDNENNLGNNRQSTTPPAHVQSTTPPAHSSGAEGGARKETDEEQKHLVPCPFLQKRRFCLKGTRCDFSHSATFPHSIQPTKTILLLRFFTTIDSLWSHNKENPGPVTIKAFNGTPMDRVFSISPETANGNPFMPSLHFPSSPLLQGTVCRNTGVIPVVSANTHKIPVRITNNRAKTVVNHINNHRQLKLVSTSIHDQAMNETTYQDYRVFSS